MTRDEVRRIARELDSHRDRALFALLVYTGARISEVLGLDVDDVRRRGIELSIRRQITYRRRSTKGSRTGRVVDVHPDLEAALLLYLGQDPSRDLGPLLLSRHGLRLSRAQASKRISAAVVAAELGDDRVSSHSTRHTFAQTLHDSGRPIGMIQELLGHADIAQTRGYIEVRPEQMAEAIRSLPDDHIGRPDPDGA